MNYHQARMRADGSGWAWTTMNDGEVHTSGGCMTWPQGEPATIAEAVGPNPKPIGPPHVHPTREEAEHCFYEHEKSHLHEIAYANTKVRCQFPGCPAWTQKALEARLLGSADLCKRHRTPEGWAAAIPFHADISIAASW